MWYSKAGREGERGEDGGRERGRGERESKMMEAKEVRDR